VVFEDHADEDAGEQEGNQAKETRSGAVLTLPKRRNWRSCGMVAIPVNVTERVSRMSGLFYSHLTLPKSSDPINTDTRHTSDGKKRLEETGTNLSRQQPTSDPESRVLQSAKSWITNHSSCMSHVHD
jgi:hypothetical protein